MGFTNNIHHSNFQPTHYPGNGRIWTLGKAATIRAAHKGLYIMRVCLKQIACKHIVYQFCGKMGRKACGINFAIADDTTKDSFLAAKSDALQIASIKAYKNFAIDVPDGLDITDLTLLSSGARRFLLLLPQRLCVNLGRHFLQHFMGSAVSRKHRFFCPCAAGWPCG